MQIENPVTQNALPPTRAARMFSALRHRDFLLFWIGAFLSNTGTWMQMVAQGWLVLELTDSPFWLGLDGAAATVPGLFLTLVGGVYADLVDRKKLLLWTQVAAGVAAFVLALLVWTNVVQVWMILALSFVTGCCMALASPSYQAITIDLAGRDDLENAIALNSTQFQLSRVAGPLLAGIAFYYVGLAGCFFFNGASFIAVVAALAAVRIGSTVHASHATDERGSLWINLVGGLQYVNSRPRVRALLLLACATSLFGGPYLTMIPVFARDIFGFDEKGLSFMMGVAGAGAFCGALTLVVLGGVRRKGLWVIVGAGMFGFCLALFALATSLMWSLVMLFGLSYAIVFSVATTNMALQQLVSDEMRGRVMSMFMLSFLGMMPFANFFAGSAAQLYGAPYTLAVGGAIIVLIAAGVFIFSERLRQMN